MINLPPKASKLIMQQATFDELKAKSTTIKVYAGTLNLGFTIRINNYLPKHLVLATDSEGTLIALLNLATGTTHIIPEEERWSMERAYKELRPFEADRD